MNNTNPAITVACEIAAVACAALSIALFDVELSQSNDTCVVLLAASTYLALLAGAFHPFEDGLYDTVALVAGAAGLGAAVVALAFMPAIGNMSLAVIFAGVIMVFDVIVYRMGTNIAYREMVKSRRSERAARARSRR